MSWRQSDRQITEAPVQIRALSGIRLITGLSRMVGRHSHSKSMPESLLQLSTLSHPEDPALSPAGRGIWRGQPWFQ